MTLAYPAGAASFLSTPSNALDIPPTHFQGMPTGFNGDETVATEFADAFIPLQVTLPGDTYAIPFVLKYTTKIRNIGGFSIPFNPFETGNNRYYGIYKADELGRPTTLIWASEAISFTGAGPVWDIIWTINQPLGYVELFAGENYALVSSYDTADSYHVICSRASGLDRIEPNGAGYYNDTILGCWKTSIESPGLLTHPNLSSYEWARNGGLMLTMGTVID